MSAPAYPAAVVARIPLTGVISVVGDGSHAWAVRQEYAFSPNGPYQLDKIDLSTNAVTLRLELGNVTPEVAAGGGGIWLTTPYGQARGQILALDPATGRVVRTFHFPAGRCSLMAYGFGRLFTVCGGKKPAESELLTVDPATGLVEFQAGPAPQGGQIAVAPQGAWFSTYGSQITGFVDNGQTVRTFTVNSAPPGDDYLQAQSLTFGNGYLWVLNNDETIAQIDPATGKVVRFYTSRSYDPARLGGPDYFVAGHGSLWLLDNGSLVSGARFGGVLRVKMSTGQLLARIPGIPPGSCGQGWCSQIYFAQGAVWVPTFAYLLRIDPARAG